MFKEMINCITSIFSSSKPAATKLLLIIICNLIIFISAFCASSLWSVIFVPMGLPELSWIKMFGIQMLLYFLIPTDGGNKD